MSGKKKTRTKNTRAKNDIVKEREHETVTKSFISLNETSLEKDEMTITGDNIMTAIKTEAENLHTNKNKKLLESASQPVFWLKGDSTKALCDELASSEANGWGKMHTCAKIASLILDTIDLCDLCGTFEKCVKELMKCPHQDQSIAKNGAPREVAIFIRKMDCNRFGLVPSDQSLSGVCPVEKHNRLMEALDKINVPHKNFGRWKAQFHCKKVIFYLKLQHNVFTWQFRDGIIAPSDWTVKKFGGPRSQR